MEILLYIFLGSLGGWVGCKLLKNNLSINCLLYLIIGGVFSGAFTEVVVHIFLYYYSNELLDLSLFKRGDFKGGASFVIGLGSPTLSKKVIDFLLEKLPPK